MRIRRGLLLGLLLALSGAGCGGGGDGGDQVATAGGRTPEPSASASPGGAEDRDAIFAYAKCMRENGVPDFPDPEVGENGEFRMRLPGGEGIDRAKVDAAQEKCKKLMPNGGEPPKADPERIEQMRRYAKCMRENGVPNFPDPNDSGGLQLDMNDLGLNGPDDPKLKAAEEKCKAFQPGGPGSGTTDRKNA